MFGAYSIHMNHFFNMQPANQKCVTFSNYFMLNTIQLTISQWFLKHKVPVWNNLDEVFVDYRGVKIISTKCSSTQEITLL